MPKFIQLQEMEMVVFGTDHGQIIIQRKFIEVIVINRDNIPVLSVTTQLDDAFARDCSAKRLEQLVPFP